MYIIYDDNLIRHFWKTNRLKESSSSSFILTSVLFSNPIINPFLHIYSFHHIEEKKLQENIVEKR